MSYSNSSNTASKLSPAQIYGDANLIFIRYDAQIETKSNGHKKIGGSRPAFSKIKEQIKYKSGVGRLLFAPHGSQVQTGSLVDPVGL